MKIILLLLLSFVPLLSPAFEPSKIIGTNDLIAVNALATNIPLKYKALVNAFGLMSMSCTATHIGNGYVLTAGHCFWVGSELAQDLPDRLRCGYAANHQEVLAWTADAAIPGDTVLLMGARDPELPRLARAIHELL